MTRIVLVPGVPALLPRYASLTDPVAELRAACEKAVGWLGEPVTVLAEDSGRAVAEHLLAGAPRSGGEASYLVVGNGSARRTDSSPGPYHPDAVGFDDVLGRGLAAGDLSGVDLGRAEELWARVGGITRLGDLLDGTPGQVDYDAAPLGVQYWVVRWHLGAGLV